MSVANLVVRFACEVAALVAFAWWGWPALGLVIAVAVAVVWGAFIAPRAARRLADPARLVVELVIFAGATAAYAGLGQPLVAVVFGIAAVVTALLVRIWPEPVAPRG